MTVEAELSVVYQGGAHVQRMDVCKGRDRKAKFVKKKRKVENGGKERKMMGQREKEKEKEKKIRQPAERFEFCCFPPKA